MGCCKLCPGPGSHSELVSQGQGGRRTALTRLSCNSSKKQACLRKPSTHERKERKVGCRSIPALNSGARGQTARQGDREGRRNKPTCRAGLDHSREEPRIKNHTIFGSWGRGETERGGLLAAPSSTGHPFCSTGLPGLQSPHLWLSTHHQVWPSLCRTVANLSSKMKLLILHSLPCNCRPHVGQVRKGCFLSSVTWTTNVPAPCYVVNDPTVPPLGGNLSKVKVVLE